jgi:competence protein ComEC
MLPNAAGSFDCKTSHSVSGDIMRKITTVFATAVAFWFALAWSASSQTMRVHFVDVGQGAATLVEFPCAAVLIDTGGETNSEFKSDDELTAYLDRFFGRRPDLKSTFHLLVLSHAHVDHTHGVPSVLSKYKILNAITNGQEPPGPGLPGQKALHDKVADTEATSDPTDDIGFVAADVKKIPENSGLTNDIIDPVKCDNVDPKIKLLWGGQDKNPGWTKTAFENQNNHSVVTRIDFGAASLLITGDLQEEAILDLVDHYRGSRMLSADVYQVGHHGSHNATTEEFLDAITPKISVISMGAPTRELPWTAWKYGHPRKDVVELLERHTGQSRPAITVQVATAVEKFEAKRIRRAIYGTGWDGTVVLETDTAGNWKHIDPSSIPGLTVSILSDTSGLININTASVEELAALPRIGSVRAKAIVDHRTLNGRFKSTDELEQVKGIGPATVVTIKKLVTVGRN